MAYIFSKSLVNKISLISTKSTSFEISNFDSGLALSYTRSFVELIVDYLRNEKITLDMLNGSDRDMIRNIMLKHWATQRTVTGRGQELTDQIVYEAILTGPTTITTLDKRIYGKDRVADHSEEIAQIVRVLLADGMISISGDSIVSIVAFDFDPCASYETVSETITSEIEAFFFDDEYEHDYRNEAMKLDMALEHHKDNPLSRVILASSRLPLFKSALWEYDNMNLTQYDLPGLGIFRVPHIFKGVALTEVEQMSLLIHQVDCAQNRAAGIDMPVVITGLYDMLGSDYKRQLCKKNVPIADYKVTANWKKKFDRVFNSDGKLKLVIKTYVFGNTLRYQAYYPSIVPVIMSDLSATMHHAVQVASYRVLCSQRPLAVTGDMITDYLIDWLPILHQTGHLDIYSRVMMLRYSLQPLFSVRTLSDQEGCIEARGFKLIFSSKYCRMVQEPRKLVIGEWEDIVDYIYTQTAQYYTAGHDKLIQLSQGLKIADIVMDIIVKCMYDDTVDRIAQIDTVVSVIGYMTLQVDAGGHPISVKYGEMTYQGPDHAIVSNIRHVISVFVQERYDNITLDRDKNVIDATFYDCPETLYDVPYPFKFLCPGNSHLAICWRGALIVDVYGHEKSFEVLVTDPGGQSTVIKGSGKDYIDKLEDSICLTVAARQQVQHASDGDDYLGYYEKHI